MKKHRHYCWLLVFGWLLVPALVYGNGFAINEQGTKAIGMGGAFVAQADDASAVYYNPAGIVQLEGTQATAGFALIAPNVTFKSDKTDTTLNTTAGRTTDIEDTTFFVPNAYVTHQINDKFSVGFGSFSNFGLGTDWPNEWEGRYLVGGTNAELITHTLNPVVAYRPIKRLSLAVGAAYQYIDIELKNRVRASALVPGEEDAVSQITGDDWDWGWNAGLLFWITDNIKFGASYRSEITHTINDGELLVTGFTHPALVGLNKDEGANAELTLPAMTFLGIAWTHGPLTVELDGQYTEWSSYDKLAATFDTATALTKVKDWDDVWAIRLGANYRINEHFDVRAGIVYDENPTPGRTLDILLPSGDRWLYTLGSSFHYGNLAIDFAYNYLDDEERKFNNPAGDSSTGAVANPRVTGEFEDVDAHIFMLNFSYKF